MQPVIAVIGAGIGGLTAALAFARQGFVVDVFEQSAELREVGAGIQLSPNATAILKELQLTGNLTKHWHAPECVLLSSGSSLRTLARVPLGAFATDRWGSPYAVVHRPDLLNALADAIDAHDSCRLHFNAGIDAASEDETQESLAKISGHRPDLIIFADGVWSRKRDSLAGSSPATFTGHVAWRSTTIATELSELLPPGCVGTFLGPDSHIVCYPLGNSGAVNLVAATPGDQAETRWDKEGDPGVLRNHFNNWNPKIIEALGKVAWHVWPLFESRNNAWKDGSKTVLIGDAAHAMSPHAAQGAAMAIEDAYELACCAKRHSKDMAAAIAEFTAIRQPRIDKVRKRGDLNKLAYHAKGPVRIARDLTLMMRGSRRLAADLDWLYGYRVNDTSSAKSG